MVHIDDPATQRANMRFIKASMREKLLSREEEQDLALRWKTRHDERALHRLVRAYTRLVVSTAGRFRNYGLPMGDLVQEGNVGLMQAAARFEPEREVRFSTYASWWIRSAMQDYVLRNWSIVRTGTTAAQKSLFFNLRWMRAGLRDAPAGGMTEEGRRKVAENLSVPLRDVEAMEMRMAASDQSLNAAVAEGSDSHWLDLLADPRPGPEDLVGTRHDTQIRKRWLAEALRELPDRERMIITKRRLSEEGATLEELGNQLGVSKERVRQLEARALEKLKHCLLARVDRPRDLMMETRG